jgi:hypothetical protein
MFLVLQEVTKTWLVNLFKSKSIPISLDLFIDYF